MTPEARTDIVRAVADLRTAVDELTSVLAADETAGHTAPLEATYVRRWLSDIIYLVGQAKTALARAHGEMPL